MIYSNKEKELAKRYVSGDLTDVQLNYLAYQNGIDKKRLRRIAKEIKSTEPFFIAAKLIIGFMFFHFFCCFAYSLINQIKQF